ncbi:LysR family transcriptional regulator [Telmatospirillum siberiense]|uniref:LysR family transcriptional regulator n=1 Tax=Telmatospirillum siberiense TaxID=382514 RepID=A0A2N3PWE2_9PROT|nr:LysR family transcriptional regulator [Telmatospirillum siberiense]PKU24695.1 LysR family transcriptional regulator [Telmatospirillum siberiense]
MDIDSVAVLVAAASAGSLSAAARRLGVTPMVATRRLAALEQDLGVRLMHRTTRSLSLTPEGEAYLPYAQALVEGEAAGRAILRSSASGASGLLRVTASVAFARKIIAPMVPRLLRANPELRIDLEMTDQVVDIVSSGVDLAIRIAKLRDSSLIAHRLAGSPRVLCASPAYLEARGAPATLEELSSHDCLALSGVTHWVFLAAGRERQVRVGGRFSSSSIEGLLEASLNAGGIGLIAEWNVRDELRQGTLVPLSIEGAVPEDLSIWAVYPSARLVLPKLRVFVAALEAELAGR